MKNYKLEKILNIYNSYTSTENAINPASIVIKAGNNASCVCVHGKRSTGKTTLLSELCDNLLKSGANVFFAVGENTLSGNGSLRELLRQLVRMYGGNFDSGLVDFINSYIKGTLVNDIANAHTKPLGKDAIVKFLYGCVKTEPIVFIIDNLDKSDTFTIDLMSRFLRINALRFLVISHTDKLENTALSDLLYKNTKSIEYVELVKNTGDNPVEINPEDCDNADIPLPDEAMLILSMPGNERQLVKHYINKAEQYIRNLDFDRACNEYFAALGVLERSKDILTDGLSNTDTLLRINLFMDLADAQFNNKMIRSAFNYYRKALLDTEMFIDNLSDAKESNSGTADKSDKMSNISINDLTKTRINLLIKLSKCCKCLNKHDKMREYIMLTEAFFCISENRARYNDLYSLHIPDYLYLLAELDEKVIFREKLKQAYLSCAPDDVCFTCRLYCEEAFMCMETGDFGKAYQLLTDAQKIAEMQNSADIWDNAVISLAICCGHMGKVAESVALWHSLINKNHNVVKNAEAMVNIALLNYGLNNDADTAVCNIQNAIDLCILAGEMQTVDDILENIRNSPLGAAFLTFT